MKPASRGSVETKKMPIPDKYNVPTIDEIGLDDETPDQKDPNFKSELAYDGYDSIVESDNNAFSLNVDRQDNPEAELNFEERVENENAVEENAVDTQEHHAKIK